MIVYNYIINYIKLYNYIQIFKIIYQICLYIITYTGKETKN